MKKSRRRMLFYALVGVFLVVTPFVLMYATGYLYDIRTGSLIPTGGIFVKANKAGAHILLDGVEQKQTSFFTAGALLTDVSVGAHRISIEKDGFRPWTHMTHVSKEIVNEYRFITLIPQTVPLVSETLFRDTAGSITAVSPNGTWRAVGIPNSPVVVIKKISDDATVFTGLFSAAPRRFFWNDDGSVIFQSSDDASEWTALSPTAAGTFEKLPIRISDPAGRVLPIVSAEPDPLGKGRFFALSRAGVLYRIPASGMAAPVLSNVIHFHIIKNEIVFVTDRGFFALSALDGSSIALAGRPGFFLNGAFSIVSSPVTGDAAVVDGVSGFFFFDNTSHMISSVQGNVRKAVFNETGTKLLLRSDDAISIFYAADEQTMPFRKKFSVVTVPFSSYGTPIDATWYARGYILVTTEKGLFGVELGITDRDAIVQKLTDESGAVTTDQKTITIVNVSGAHTYAIE